MNEREFLHDIINPLTIAEGHISRIISKSEQLSKDEILTKVNIVQSQLEKVFELVEERKRIVSS